MPDQPFEEAILACIDYFSFGQLAQRTRYRLIRKALEEAHIRFGQFNHLNGMRRVQGIPLIPYQPERAGVSQLFFYCYHQVIKGGNPGPKLALIQTAIFDSPLFKTYRPKDDENKSRRSGPNLMIQDLSDDLDEEDLPE